MGQVIFIGFFSLAAMCLATLGYFTGRYDAMEEMEGRYEQEKDKAEREADITARIRCHNRRHKRIDYDLRSGY